MFGCIGKRKKNFSSQPTQHSKCGSKTVDVPYEEAVEEARAALKEEGFGVLCEDDKQPMEIRKPRPSISMFVFIACGIWLIGLGLYFMLLRPPLLPEDLRYIGTSAGEIQSALPGLERWTHRVFTVMGGFMTGAGLLTILVARNTSDLREKWTWAVLGLAGLFTVGTMSLTNFQLNSNFKWLLLIPSLLWGIGLVFPAVFSRRDG